MLTVHRIRKTVSIELGKELEKDVFRLVMSVGQREKSFSIFLTKLKTLSPFIY